MVPQVPPGHRRLSARRRSRRPHRCDADLRGRNPRLARPARTGLRRELPQRHITLP